MTSTDRSWLTKGAKVALLSFTMGVPSGVRFRTVDRFTTTQVVLDDDTRWRLKDLHPVGEDRGGYETASSVLVPLDDPRITPVRVGARLRNLHHTITPLLSRPRIDTDVAGAMELIAQVKQAVADTEARIATLSPPTSKEQ